MSEEEQKLYTACENIVDLSPDMWRCMYKFGTDFMANMCGRLIASTNIIVNVMGIETETKEIEKETMERFERQFTNSN